MQKGLLEKKILKAPVHMHFSHILDERFNLLDPENYLRIYGKDHRG